MASLQRTVARSLVAWLTAAACIAQAKAAGSAEASFYGHPDSYLTWGGVSSDIKTELSLQVKTRAKWGVLLFGAGATDYLSVFIRDGAMVVATDLGSGGVELSSRGVTIADGSWHTVRFTRSYRLADLGIDGVQVASARLPGVDYKLDLTSIFVAKAPAVDQSNRAFTLRKEYRQFRGCLSHVIYNGLDLLATSATTASNDNHTVGEGCSDEFGALGSQSFSIDDRQSASATFVVDDLTRGVSFEFFSKTRELSDLVLASIHSPDDISSTVSIAGGREALMISGRLPSESQPPAGGQWHSLNLSCATLANRRHCVIAIDGSRAYTMMLSLPTLGNGGSALLVIGSDQLQDKTASARPADRSIASIMCYRNIMLDNRVVALAEAASTRNIALGCAEYISGEHGCQIGAARSCQSPVGTADEFLSKTLPAVLVEQGDMLPITIQHFGLNATSKIAWLLLKTKPPAGTVKRLIQRSWLEVGAGSNFTYQDLASGSLVYVHSTSTEARDIMTWLLATETDDNQLRVVVQAMTMPVEVLDINTRPVIIAATREATSVIANSSCSLPLNRLVNVLRVNRSNSIIYAAYNTFYGAQLESSLQRGLPLFSFEIGAFDNGEIVVASYASQSSAGLSSISLHVVQENRRSQTANVSIRVLPKPPEQTCSVTVAGWDSAVYPMQCLVTGPEDPPCNLSYFISDPPRGGYIEENLFSAGGTGWSRTTTFTSRHVQEKKIRYVNANHLLAMDKWTVVASCQQECPIATSSVSVKITPINVTVSVNSLTIDKANLETPVTNESIAISSESPGLQVTSLVYRIVKYPSVGSIITYNRTTVPKTVASFSQADIDRGLILYRLHRFDIGQINDSVHLVIQTPPPAASRVYALNFVIVESKHVRLSTTTLAVDEGKENTISTRHLLARYGTSDLFSFAVITQPRHGAIVKLDSGKSAINASVFTSDDIRFNKIRYRHDDSETRLDSFEVLATWLDKGQPSSSGNISALGVVNISINLLNDNPPVRVSNGVLYATRNHLRLITSEDWKFVDNDISQSPADTQYRRRLIPCGDIVRADNPAASLYIFTQDDVDRGQVLFKSNGVAACNTSALVTDGRFSISDPLYIEAVDPVISVIHRNQQLSVSAGAYAPVTASELDIATNIYAQDAQIRFVISQPPKHGKLVIRGLAVVNFSLADIKKGELVYAHDGACYADADRLAFYVEISGLRQSGELVVLIVRPQTLQPLRFVSSSHLTLNANGQAIITSLNLKVSHPYSSAEAIRYVVAGAPAGARLLLVDENERLLGGDSAVTFTQADVERSRVLYEASSGARSSGSQGSLILYATNGHVNLTNISLEIQAAENGIVVDCRNLSVSEDSSISFRLSSVVTVSHNDKDKRLFVVVVQEPLWGYLENYIDYMSLDSDARVVYVHGGSESTGDKVSLLVTSKPGSASGAVCDVNIKVIPVNDNHPSLRMKPISVFSGFAKRITNATLMAEDLDSDFRPDAIVYKIVSGADIGYFAKWPAFNKPVTEFSQADINEGKTVFVHAGNGFGQMSFTVSEEGYLSDTYVLDVVPAKSDFYPGSRWRPVNVFPSLGATIVQGNSEHEPSAGYHIMYTVALPPQWGRLTMKSGGGQGARAEPATVFSQRDFDERRLRYEQTVQIRVRSLPMLDIVALEISGFPRVQSDHLLLISFNISLRGPLDDDPARTLVTTRPLSITEGGSALITFEHLDVGALEASLAASNGGLPVTVQFAVCGAPAHGVLQDTENKTFEPGSQFAPADLASRRIVYRHDHSHNASDAFAVCLDIEGIRTSRVIACQVAVALLDDRAPKLVTASPVVSVVQGSVTPLSSHVLLTTDEDTPRDKITYRFVGEGPRYGELIRASGEMAAVARPAQPTNTFSQLAVDLYQVAYRHRGDEIAVDRLPFVVGDGVHPPLSGTLSVRAEPLYLRVAEFGELRLAQGTSARVLTGTLFNLSTNGAREQVRYSVTTAPSFGIVAVEGRLANGFAQADVDMGLVTYTQNNMAADGDSFGVTASLRQGGSGGVGGGALASITVYVLVEPVLVATRRRLEVSLAGWTQVRLAHLDATALRNASGGSEPTYRVVVRPLYGTLRVASDDRNGRDGRPKESDYFTHADVEEGRVFFAPQSRDDLAAWSTDQATLSVSARGVQPARLTLLIVAASAVGSSQLPQQQQQQQTPQRSAGGGASARSPQLDSPRSWKPRVATPLGDEESEEKTASATGAETRVESAQRRSDERGGATPNLGRGLGIGLGAAIGLTVALAAVAMLVRRRRARRRRELKAAALAEPKVVLKRENGTYTLLVQGAESSVAVVTGTPLLDDGGGGSRRTSFVVADCEGEAAAASAGLAFNGCEQSPLTGRSHLALQRADLADVSASTTTISSWKNGFFEPFSP